jgi:hypothetical protein
MFKEYKMRKQKKYHYIYKTTCLITGKFYIGMHSTSNLEDGYLGSEKILGYSRRKYGDENHKKEILEFLNSRAELKVREAQLVNEDILKESLCINLKIGGEGGWEFITKFLSKQQLKDRAINSHLKQIELKNTDPDWVKKKSVNMSITLKQQYKDGRKSVSYFSSEAIKKVNSVDTNIKRINTLRKSNHQQGEKNSNFGKRNKCVSKEGITKRIQISEIDSYLNDGWVLGIKK